MLQTIAKGSYNYNRPRWIRATWRAQPIRAILDHVTISPLSDWMRCAPRCATLRATLRPRNMGVTWPVTMAASTKFQFPGRCYDVHWIYFSIPTAVQVNISGELWRYLRGAFTLQIWSAVVYITINVIVSHNKQLRKTNQNYVKCKNVSENVFKMYLKKY